MTGFSALLLLMLAAGPQDALSGALPADPDEAALLQSVSLLQHGRSSLHRHSKGGAGSAPARAGNRLRWHVPKATVNLDLPPEERWYDFYVSQRGHFLELYARGDFAGLFPRSPSQAEREAFLASIDLSGYGELLREHEGIIRAVNDTSLVNRTFLLWAEVAYERAATMGCTALLAAAPDGSVFHGRNLDLNEGAAAVPGLVDVTFVRGGRPLVVATSFLGMVGLSTFYRPGAWSFAQNTRGGCDDVAANAAAARAGGAPFGLLARRLAMEVPDFETAVQALASAPLMAPMYFTVAGPGPYEGALITRDRLGSLPPYGNVVTLSPQIERWFIVQTNDDIARPPLDPRRPAALVALEAMQQKGVRQDSILQVLMRKPVHNPLTVFTWVIDWTTGRLQMLLGDAELPA